MSRALFVKLDVDYADNPRIAAAGEKAELAYIRILCLCKKMRSDGVLTAAQLKRLAIPRLSERLRKLNEVGLIVWDGEDVIVTGWLQRNLSAQEIDSQPTVGQHTTDSVSTARRQAGRKGGLASAQVRWGAGKQNGKQLAYEKVSIEKEKEEEEEITTGNLPVARRAERPRDLLFEAVAEECGIDWHNLTPSSRGPLARAVAELRKVDAVPEEVPDRAMRYRNRFRDAPLTPTALAKHWPSLSAGARAMAPKISPNMQALARVSALVNGNGSNGSH